MQRTRFRVKPLAELHRIQRPLKLTYNCSNWTSDDDDNHMTYGLG